MTLKEAKTKVLSLIEELNPTSSYLTDDPDIQAKINSVFNQIQVELCRLKKIPAKYEYNIYQLNNISTDKYILKGDMEIFFEEEAGTKAIIYYYKYPTPIDVIITPQQGETAQEASARIDNTYTFELTEDVLEIMPYGVAADLLKNDMISNYGKYYDERYRTMLQMIDSRISSGLIVAEGGLDI